MLAQNRKAPLEAVRLPFLACFLLVVVLVLLVDGIIGEVDELFAQRITAVGIWFSGESYEAILMKVSYQRIKTCHQDINTQIILKPSQ